MAKYSTFKYGTLVLYGEDTSLASVDPPSGPSTGGNSFVLAGAGLTLSSFDDDFTAGALDAALWTDVSTFTGTLTTGATHLRLSTGTTVGSIAGIETIATMTSFRGEIEVNIPRITQYPASEVSFITVSLFVDASNYADMSIVVGSTSDDITLRCQTVVGGTVTAIHEEEWSTGLSTLSVMRWGSYIYFIANGSLIYTAKSFISTIGNYRIYSYNDAAAYDVANVTVNSFRSRPFVVFGDAPVWDTVTVSQARVRGTVPPSYDVFGTEAAYAGLVNVYYVSASVTSLANAYEYYYEKGLVLLYNRQEDLVLSISDDPVIRTPDSVRRGL